MWRAFTLFVLGDSDKVSVETSRKAAKGSAVPPRSPSKSHRIAIANSSSSICYFCNGRELFLSIWGCRIIGHHRFSSLTDSNLVGVSCSHVEVSLEWVCGWSIM